MKIVSATMAGRGVSTEMLSRALLSTAPFVEECYVLDTGMTAGWDLDFPEDVMRTVVLTTDKEPWVNDFALMRNTLLRRAHEATDADWIIMVDSDETLKLCDIYLRQFLADATDDVYSVEHVSGHYGKPRIFRAPVKGKFTGPAHEAYESPGAPCPILKFDEEAKSPEQYREKFEHDRDILVRHLKSSPENPGRWHFYLGET